VDRDTFFAVLAFQIHYSSVTQTFSLLWSEFQRFLLNVPQTNKQTNKQTQRHKQQQQQQHIIILSIE